MATLSLTKELWREGAGIDMLDLLLHPELIEKAWDYYKNVNQRHKVQEPSETGRQACNLAESKTMEEYRPRMKAFYYDPSKYDSYLEQLGSSTLPCVQRHWTNDLVIEVSR